MQAPLYSIWSLCSSTLVTIAKRVLLKAAQMLNLLHGVLLPSHTLWCAGMESVVSELDQDFICLFAKELNKFDGGQTAFWPNATAKGAFVLMHHSYNSVRCWLPTWYQGMGQWKHGRLIHCFTYIGIMSLLKFDYKLVNVLFFSNHL